LATNEIAALFSHTHFVASGHYAEISGQRSTAERSRPRPKLDIIALETTGLLLHQNNV